jgi:hypothetical protein
MADRTPAEQAGDEAAKKVKQAADARIVRAIEKAVKAAAEMWDQFTTDQVWTQLAQHKLPKFEPRLLGPVMRDMAARGYIAMTEEYENSQRRACHGRPLRIWQSLVRG